MGPMESTRFCVMTALTNGAGHGYAIQQAIMDDGGWFLHPTTVYRILEWLTAKGWARELPDAGRRGRRKYELTGSGRRYLRLEAAKVRKMAALAEERLREY